MTTPPKPLDEMNEAEARAWKEQLAKLGMRPVPFAWGPAPELFESHSGPLCFLEMSDDGKKVTSASPGFIQTLKVWEIDCGRLLSTAKYYRFGHGLEMPWTVDIMLSIWRADPALDLVNYGWAEAISVGRSERYDWAVFGYEAGSVEVWNMESGRLMRTIPGQGSPVRCVAVSADASVVASGSDDGVLRIWRFAEPPVSESQYNYEPVLDKVIENSPDGRRYIVGVQNAELQRLQELKEADRPGLLQDLRPVRSR